MTLYKILEAKHQNSEQCYQSNYIAHRVTDGFIDKALFKAYSADRVLSHRLHIQKANLGVVGILIRFKGVNERKYRPMHNYVYFMLPS